MTEEIESSRLEIAKLQERVRQLVARRGKRAELVKSAHNLPMPELPEKAAMINGAARSADADTELGQELTTAEGLEALKGIKLSEVRLIAFKHGAVIFLLADEKTLTVQMDERGPKPLLDLLSANEQNGLDSSTSGHSTDQARA